LLPTFLFVIGVYSIFGLLTAWRQRAKRFVRSAKLKPRPRWGALLMPIGMALLVARALPGAPPYHINLVKVLGEEERGGLEGQVLTYPTGFPMCVHATEVPPIYSLLHPQVTTHIFIPEKKTPIIYLRKPQRKVPLKVSDKKVKIDYSLAMKMPVRKYYSVQ
jgi:hypothetical protein